MAFGMFSAQHSPVAIDFGSSSVKLLQIGSGDRPALLAAAEIPVPDSIRGDSDRLMTYYTEWLPKLLRDGKFRGKRAVIAVPSLQTYIGHMQITETPDVGRDDLVKGQLQTQMGVSPHGVVVRSIEVCPVNRNGQVQTEMICFAITRDTVMRFVDLLKKCKLEVAGVHTETLAMVRAFDHLNRRESDVNVTTLYIDLGWSGTRVAITHGKQMVFARFIPIGGKHFDQLIASTVHCDVHSARAHRLSIPSSLTHRQGAVTKAITPAPAREPASTGMGVPNAAVNGEQAEQDATTTTAPERRTGVVPAELRHTLSPGDAPSSASVDVSELLDTITDELSMCMRYHQGLFKGRPVDRAIFVGGEARQSWLCQHAVKALRIPAQLGDPLARLQAQGAPTTPGLTLGKPQPGWTVACGLCHAPTEL
jgi:Tfp pilus assembly PilM family ATPase